MKRKLYISVLPLVFVCLLARYSLDASLTIDSDLLINGNLESTGNISAGEFVLQGTEEPIAQWEFSVDSQANVLSLTRDDQEVLSIFKEGYIRFKPNDLDPESWFPYDNEGNVYLTSNSDIAGTGDFVFRRWDDTEGYEILLKVNGLNGNVGIGTETPTQKMEIDGNLKVTGSIIMEPRGDIPMFGVSQE